MGEASERDGTAVAPISAEAHQEQLARGERLAALREIVSFVAHELHQPLASIAASGEAALRWLDREEPALAEARASLDRVLTHKERVAEVIANIRAPLERSDRHGSSDLAVAARVAASRLGRNRPVCKVEVQAAELSVLAALAPVDAELLFHHLLRNGAEAMEGKAARTLKVRLSSDAEWIQADVHDAGGGIAEADRSRVFDPFFTTKPGAEGLGLTIARSIARASGGRLEVLETGPGGTVFRVRIPIAAA